MAHQESFDPKPFAPIEYRGEMGVVQTKIEGVFFNECLTQTAQIADKITVCRSMTHGEAAHERGTHNMFTGYRPSPALVYPSMGSVVSHEFGVRNNLPPYVCIPSQPTNYAGTGYLPARLRPVQPRAATRPTAASACRTWTCPAASTTERFAHPPDDARRRQRALRRQGEVRRRRRRWTPSTSGPTACYQLAEGPRGVQHQRRAGQAPRRVRPQRRRPADAAWPAGWSRPACGSSPLTYGGWDMHGGIAGGMPAQLPQFDQAFAALIRDLDRAACSNRRWSWSRASSAGRRRSTARRPRPLAEGLQRRPGRRRHQEGLRLRLVGRDGARAGGRPAHGRRPGEHGLPPARHRRGQEADGPGQPADDHRRRRQGAQGTDRIKPIHHGGTENTEKTQRRRTQP